jgi:hypothetical protein
MTANRRCPMLKLIAAVVAMALAGTAGAVVGNP